MQLVGRSLPIRPEDASLAVRARRRQHHRRVGLAYGGYRWYESRAYVSTDDAYVEGTITSISAKVPGHVAELLVQDNQPVKKGDLLLRIDPRDYQARRNQAASAVATAEAGVRSARSEVPLARDDTSAQIDQARASLEMAQVAVRSAEAAVEEARARLEAKRAATDAMRAEVVGAESAARNAGRERERMDRLVKGGFVAQRDFDTADSAMETASASLDATRRRHRAGGARGPADRGRAAGRGVWPSSRLTSAWPRPGRRSPARRAGGTRSISRGRRSAGPRPASRRPRPTFRTPTSSFSTRRCALPLDGIVSKRTVELGQVVQMGQPLLAIVPLHEVWVVANFKETQLGARAPGPAGRDHGRQPTRARSSRGRCNSISAGTGRALLLAAPRERHGQLGQGRPAHPGQDPARRAARSGTRSRCAPACPWSPPSAWTDPELEGSAHPWPLTRARSSSWEPHPEDGHALLESEARVVVCDGRHRGRHGAGRRRGPGHPLLSQARLHRVA